MIKFRASTAFMYQFFMVQVFTRIRWVEFTAIYCGFKDSLHVGSEFSRE